MRTFFIVYKKFSFVRCAHNSRYRFAEHGQVQQTHNAHAYILISFNKSRVNDASRV